MATHRRDPLDDAAPLRALRIWRADPARFIEEFLWIRDKNRRVVPFKLNFAQRWLHQHWSRRNLVLKPRQVGATSYIGARMLSECLVRPQTHAVMVAHEQSSAERIFEAIRGFVDHLPQWWHDTHPLGRATRTELFWPSLGSRFWTGTAGSSAFGRGMSIDLLHGSEYAHWTRPEEVLAALAAAVPDSGTITLESTPNGAGGHFHSLWTEARQGLNGWTPHLFGWFEDESYRIDEGPPLGELSARESELQRLYHLDEGQLRWRRARVREFGERFPQEFVEDDVSCFLTTGRCVFNVAALLRARERAQAQPGQAIDSLVLPRMGTMRSPERLQVAPGRLTIWEHPEPGRRYCIGGDTAMGTEDGDYSAAVIVARDSGAQVGELCGHWQAHHFARLLAAVGMHYNRAMIGVEADAHGYTVLSELRNHLWYSMLFFHIGPDRSGPKLGWPSTAQTRPVLIDDLASTVEEDAALFRSLALIEQLLTFVTKEGGRQEALDGCHDDLVIAAGVALQVRKQPMARGSAHRPEGW